MTPPPVAFQAHSETNNNYNPNELNELRIPTGRKQTGWLIYKCRQELNHGVTGTNTSQLVVKPELECRITEFHVWHLLTNYWSHCLLNNIIIYYVLRYYKNRQHVAYCACSY